MKIFNRHINREPVIFILSLFLLLISIILLARPNIEGTIINYVFTNSDSFFHHTFYQDIIIERTPIDLWIFPHAFLLLPEFVIFLTSKIIFQDQVVNMNVFTSIFTLFLLETSLFLLLRSNQKIQSESNSLYIAGIAVFNLFLGVKEMTLIYIFLLTPHFHIGTIFNSLIALLIFERACQSNTKPSWLITIYAILTFIFSFSDPLYLIYFVVPMVLINIPGNLKNVYIEKKVSLFKNITVLLSILGFGIFFFSLRMTTYHSIKLPQAKYIIPIDFFSDKILYTPFSGKVFLDNNLLLISVLLTLIIFSVYKMGIASISEGRGYFVKMFLIFNFLLSLFLYCFWGAGTWMDFRVFTTSTMLVTFSLLSKITRITNNKTVVMLLLLLFSILLLHRFSGIKSSFTKIFSKDMDSVKCVEVIKRIYDFKYGISDFWWATKLNTLGNYKFRLLPINNTYYKHDLSENKAFGDSRFENGKTIDYVFCATTEEKNYTMEILGNPDNIFECPNNQWVLYYQNGRINDFYK